MDQHSERLYQQLPSLHRRRDQEAGEPLRALMGVLQAELERLERDLDGLYDNSFIETCQEWVVPYIADLLGLRSLVLENPRAFSLRAWVAGALRNRRRKGTVGALERLARDITSWPCVAVELAFRVSTTQHVRRLRPEAMATPNLRDGRIMSRVGGPFDLTPHLGVVRSLSQEGLHLPGRIALFLYRKRAYPLWKVEAVPRGGQYLLHPAGVECPLFTLPRTSADPDNRVGEENTPSPVLRAPLCLELHLRRLAMAAGEGVEEGGYFGDPPCLRVWVVESGITREIQPEAMFVADLSGRSNPPVMENLTWTDADGQPRPAELAVDPESGRVLLAPQLTVEKVLSSFSYGAPSELGGGPYRRAPSPPAAGEYLLEVPTDTTPDLAAALTYWKDVLGSAPCQIRLLTSDTQALVTVDIPEGSSLTLLGADGQWPCLTLSEAWGISLAGGATLRLEGLIISAPSIQVNVTGEADLHLAHCTVVPSGSLEISGSSALRWSGTRCVFGPLLRTSGPETGTLSLTECVVDGGEAQAMSVTGHTLLRGCTVRGGVELEILELATDNLLDGVVVVRRQQVGAIRYCWANPGSVLPSRYRCLPEADTDTGDGQLSYTQQAPRFVDTRYGYPGYLDLAPNVHPKLLTAASDEGELGVFNHLQRVQREAALRAGLREHLHPGMDTDLFFVT